MAARNATRAQRRELGHSLVESMVSMAVFVTIVGGIFSLLRGSSGVLHESLRAATARHHCSDVVDTVGRELEQANPATLTVDATHPEGDQLHLQVPLTCVNGVVTWGVANDPNGSGVTYPNATVTYLLTQRQGATLWTLVRRIVGVNGLPIGADQTIVDGVEVPDATHGKGFAVVRNNRLVTLSVRVQSDGLDRSHQVTLQLRNS